MDGGLFTIVEKMENAKTFFVKTSSKLIFIIVSTKAKNYLMTIKQGYSWAVFSLHTTKLMNVYSLSMLQ